jgi:hypothetical protein
LSPKPQTSGLKNSTPSCDPLFAVHRPRILFPVRLARRHPRRADLPSHYTTFPAARALQGDRREYPLKPSGPTESAVAAKSRSVAVTVTASINLKEIPALFCRPCLVWARAVVKPASQVCPGDVPGCETCFPVDPAPRLRSRQQIRVVANGARDPRRDRQACSARWRSDREPS